MYEIVIIGAGGFGREVYQWAKATFPATDYRFKGFLSNNPTDLDGFNLDIGVIGSDDSYVVQENDRFLLAIGSIPVKKRIAEHFKTKGACFLTLVHPTALVADTATLGEGVILCPFSTVSDHAVIEDFAALNLYASCGHDAHIGRYGVLSPYATLNGFAYLEEGVFLGTHATVVAKRRVGAGSQISANSVALYSVPPQNLVVGVPGKNSKIHTPG